MKLSVTLPWPDSRLSQNGRLHWAKRGSLVKEARALAGWTALQAGARTWGGERANVTVTFVPPDGRRRDVDNMIAASKAYGDGIADAIGIDDSQWTVKYKVMEPSKGGHIRYDIEEG